MFLELLQLGPVFGHQRSVKVRHDYIQDTSSAPFFSLCPEGLICKADSRFEGIVLAESQDCPSSNIWFHLYSTALDSFCLISNKSCSAACATRPFPLDFQTMQLSVCRFCCCSLLIFHFPKKKLISRIARCSHPTNNQPFFLAVNLPAPSTRLQRYPEPDSSCLMSNAYHCFPLNITCI